MKTKKPPKRKRRASPGVRADKAAIRKMAAATWTKQLLNMLTKLEMFESMPALNGTKWKEGTGRYYKKKLVAFLAQAPPGCETRLAEYKKRIDALPW